MLQIAQMTAFGFGAQHIANHQFVASCEVCLSRGCDEVDIYIREFWLIAP